MAAGWHGSYNGSRSRESSDVEVSRRKDHYQDRYSDDDRQRSRSRELRDAGGAGGSGMKRSRLSGRVASDREPGELSSGSGSDDPVVAVARGKGDERGKRENVSSSSSNGKRKFSPIVWDLDDGKGSKSVDSRSRNERVEEPVITLPPPPLLPHGYVPTGLVRQSTEHASPSNTEDPVDSPQDQRVGGDREPGQLVEEEEDDYVPARNISTSRWADGNNALDDDDAETEEIVPNKRSAPLPNSVDSHSRRKTLSPEFDKASRQASGGSVSRSSSSEGEHRDRCREVELDKKEYMEVDIDGDEPADVVSDHLSDTDSEDSSDGIRTLEPDNPPPRSVNMLQGCRSVDEFERLNKIDEGTYGVVYRAKDKKSGEIVALKKVKMEKEREGFPLTSLREINILLSFHHPSIVDVKEVVVGSSLDSIFMVMEYMEHDLKALMETMKQPFSQSEVKCLMLQLLDGVKYLHDNWVLHRDLKTSNLLLNNRGELKICDFGLSRQYGSPLKPYTQLVVTLWYRAPELLLGAKGYSTAIDMWSLGCIMAEFLAKEPLFSGKTEFDQLDKIFRTLGTPNEKIWPGFSKLPGVKVNFVKQPYNKLREKFPPTSFSGRPTLSEAGFDLLNKLLTYDPEKRITAKDALNHNWFREVPLPKSKDFMPTFPAQHAQDRRLRRTMKSPDPLEEQRRKELQQGSLGTGSLFG